MRSRLLVVALVAGCRGDFALPPASPGNAAPLAQAGTGGTFRVLSTVLLDGKDSVDPDGQIALFHWTIESAPQGSTATLANAETEVASFVPDKVGEYALRLQVTDDLGLSDTSDVVIPVRGPAIDVNAGSDGTVPWFARVQLAGSASVEAPFAASYVWKIVDKPPGSTTVLANANGLAPSFRADVVGPYTVRLTGTSDYGEVSDEVTIVAQATPQALGRIRSVAYSRAADRLLVTKEGSQYLTIHDPATDTDELVDLTRQWPSTVAPAPSEARVAVGLLAFGNNGTAIVNLQSKTLEQIVETPDEEVFLYGPGNRFHTYDRFQQVVTHDLPANATSVLSITSGPFLVRDSSGTVVYALPRFGGSVAQRIDLTAATPSVLYEVNVDPTVAIDGEAYTTEDGALVARDGTLLRITGDPATDLSVRGQIAPGVFAHSLVTHEMAVGQSVFNAWGNLVGSTLTFFDDTTLAPRLTVPLPQPQFRIRVPRWMGYRADGRTLMIVTTDSSSSDAELFTVTP